VYESAKAQYRSQPFQEAPTLDKASLTDMLQELINRDHAVTCVQVSSGWMEIHSFEDYKLACRLVAR
jgi:phosphoenolpyruvate phosphomutase